MARALHGLQFAVANSAWFCRDSNTDSGSLWLGQPLLESMDLMRPEDFDTAPLAVALVHHPQEWLHDANRYSYDRPASYRYLAERVHLILSGHTHGGLEPMSRCFDRARLSVAGAGYSGNLNRNNFSLFQIDRKRRTMERRRLEWNPSEQRWEEKTCQTYSLNAERINTYAPPEADTAKYFSALRDKTRSIELNQLAVDTREIPPPEIDTLFIPLTTAAGSRDMAREPVKLGEALKAHRKLVIEGDAGSGKTTFVRWIAWMLCRPDGPRADLKWLAGFPVWVRISELDTFIGDKLDRNPDPSWIAKFLASRRWNLDEAFFEVKFREPSTVLLLDGLDEAANHQRRVDIVKTIREAAVQFECRVVVTSRPAAHEGRTALGQGFETVRIDPLDDRGIDGFLWQWRRWLKRGEEDAAREYFESLRPAVAVPAIRHLARNPLMLTSLAVLHFRRHRLPEQRVKLYGQILDWLAEQATDKHREPKELLLERLGQLALSMQERPEGQKLSVGIDDAAKLLTPKTESHAPMRAFLEGAQLHSGIVTLRGGEIAFWHRSFQEYLAARTISLLADANIPLRTRKMLYTEEGREVLPLLAGCTVGGRERLNLLL